jgi:PelA/Pel-15E family pectate lyase
MAYLAAYRATSDKFYLDAAREAGAALIHGQLNSGGWTQVVDFDPKGSKVAQYRNGKGRGKSNSTLDDGISQSAIQFLAKLDQALELKDAEVHGAATYALDALLKAQFENGAFPQVWTGPVSKQAVVKASYPEYEWRTEGRLKEYWTQYTLNDGLAGTVTQTLLVAAEVYHDPKYQAALTKLGDFLLLAQMPAPQPAWSQQYSYDMHPIWARKFEPPAVTGGESQDVLETLLKIYRVTGDKKYLAPFPAALAYLKKSQLKDGRLARYLFGIDYAPKEQKLALVEAPEGRIGGVVDQLLLLCYHYDTTLGRYTAVSMLWLRITAAATLAAVVSFIALMLLRERRARRRLAAGGVASV